MDAFVVPQEVCQTSKPGPPGEKNGRRILKIDDITVVSKIAHIRYISTINFLCSHYNLSPKICLKTHSVVVRLYSLINLFEKGRVQLSHLVAPSTSWGRLRVGCPSHCPGFELPGP